MSSMITITEQGDYRVEEVTEVRRHSDVAIIEMRFSYRAVNLLPVYYVDLEENMPPPRSASYWIRPGKTSGERSVSQLRLTSQTFEDGRFT